MFILGIFGGKFIGLRVGNKAAVPQQGSDCYQPLAPTPNTTQTAQVLKTCAVFLLRQC